MLLLILKILILITLIYIAIQDFKEREIYLFLVVGLGVLLLIYRLQITYYKIFLLESLLNLSLIAVLVGTLSIYSKLRLKTNLFKVFGLGDLLFFIAISLGLATIPFFVLFVFSLVFSLIIFLALKKRLRFKTVPLAGLQAVFFFVVFVLDWCFGIIDF